MFIKDSYSDSSSSLLLVNNYLEDYESIDMPLAVSMQPRPDLVSYLALIMLLFHNFNINIANSLLVILDQVLIQDGFLVNDKNLMDFMQKSNTSKLDLS